MKVNFLNKTGHQEWNKFLLENQGSFLQSFEWGEFQKKLSKKIWRIVVKRNNKTIAQAQIIRESFPFKIKNIFYIPFGPCLDKSLLAKEQKLVLEEFLKKIQEFSKKEKAIFLRVEPLTELILPSFLPYKISNKKNQPQKTLILDLRKTEEEIFGNFSQKVRYNIRLAQKKGVKIEVQDKYSSDFYSLIQKTSKRDNFLAFKEEHYKKLFSCSSSDLKVKLFLAKYENKVIASYILILFGKMAICLHGASDWNYRALKAPNLAQWERIRLAKEMGAEKIDFWGIDEKKWPGLTAFKKGFNGQELIYPLAKDIIFQKSWYNLYQVMRKLRQNI